MGLFETGAVIGELNYDLISLALGADPKQASARLLERIQSVFDDLDERVK